MEGLNTQKEINSVEKETRQEKIKTAEKTVRQMFDEWEKDVGTSFEGKEDRDF